ncbi:hypothetical protein PRIEUP_LOCUS6743, partial [Pristimantis euphronides]
MWSAPVSPNQPFSKQTKQDLKKVTHFLISEADKLCTEICEIPNLCANSDEHLWKVDLKLPEIKDAKSGCLSTNFDKKTCLPKIYRDLHSFQPYLEFLKESMPSNKNIIESLQIKSISLANHVKQLEHNSSIDKVDTTPGTTVVDLKPKDTWSKNRTNYIILQSFKEYMEKTVRALRYI